MPRLVSAGALAASREAMLAAVIDSRPYDGDHAPMKDRAGRSWWRPPT
jgi:hypothetical protein